MPRLFANQVLRYGDPVVFTTPGRYSMPVAAQILEHLELKDGCEVQSAGWKRPDYGELVEVGVAVCLGTVEFTIMSSYEDILIQCISGSKAKFYEFCDSIRGMNFET